jgi:hypothetical protein
MTGICALDERPTGDDATLCPRCTARLERDLRDIPHLLHELEITLSRQDHVTTITPTPQTADRDEDTPAAVSALPAHLRPAQIRAYAPAQALPLNVNAARVLTDLRDALRAGVRDHATTSDPRPADHPAALAAWLLDRIERIRHTEHGADITYQLADITSQARRAIDTAGVRWYAGPCHAPLDDGTVCDRELYAAPGESIIACRCGAHHDVTARRDWLREAARDHLGTPTEISALCRHMLGDLVTTAMIRGYAHRHQITAHGTTTDPRGRQAQLYVVGDVIAAAARAGATPQARRDARRAARDATPSDAA